MDDKRIVELFLARAVCGRRGGKERKSPARGDFTPSAALAIFRRKMEA